jgi:hypothetical protein
VLVQRDEDVDVAIGVVLATRDRSEQTHIVSVAKPSCSEQLGPVGGDELS